MENICFILIDDGVSYHSPILLERLKEKLSDFDFLIVGTKESVVADKTFAGAKECYQFLAREKKNKHLLIINAYAALLSLDDTIELYQYTVQGQYDVCLTENIPDGLIPMMIHKDFSSDFPYFIEENTPLNSQFKTIINWEFKGIDVGIFLSKDFTILRRVDFLPVNKGAAYALEQTNGQPLLTDLDQFIRNHPLLLRNVPHFVAIELSPRTDKFYTVDNEHHPHMTVESFQKIFRELQTFSPNTVLALGVWGDPFCNAAFKEIFALLESSQQHVIVEIRGLNLDRDLCTQVLSRKNTDLVIDVSFSTEDAYRSFKDTGYSLMEVKKFIESLPNQERVRPRLTRTPESEEHIKNFLQMFPHSTIIKADSLGIGKGHVVDLSPIQRHSCFALRRELTILSNGDVLLCRQATDNIIGSVYKESLEDIWNKNQPLFDKQEQGDYDSCHQCSGCDDWWIWN